jgi:hypothetical protein
VQPIGLAGVLADQRGAITREVSEFSNRRWRHKAAPHEPVLHQLRDPDAVLDVRLPPRHLRDLGGVGQHTRERVLEHVEDRFPVDPGALHGDVRDAIGAQPVPQRQ